MGWNQHLEASALAHVHAMGGIGNPYTKNILRRYAALSQGGRPAPRQQHNPAAAIQLERLKWDYAQTWPMNRN